ncbi:glycosyltransferase family 4 protein [Hyphomonas adhaerens]|uniref:glycosyltransferase family 4 protein n=1 Tax=Hyphomonas adhaerens TaxID=81029 RepID=UPI0023530E80|nr:glycosyltransferase family 4 protein [Hyphomonas adhaerens]
MTQARWSGLPDYLLAGSLSCLAERTHLPLAIIGPGPTLNDIDPANIPEEVIRFRMNMFFSEPTPRFGRRVDGYFWANDLDVMYELMQSTHEEGIYDYKLFFTPNEIKPERPTGQAVADRCRKILHPRYDHWWLISHHPDVVRNMLLRPLPTQTFQALATALILGFRDIHLVGIDMYRNKGERYAHAYSDDIKARLDEKHRTPGYEDAAHSERRDLAFLEHLKKCFSDARIHNASSVSPLREVLPDSPLMHGRPLVVENTGPDMRSSLMDRDTELMRLSAEVAALRASRSYQLGQAVFKPLALFRNGMRSLMKSSPASLAPSVKPQPKPAVSKPKPASARQAAGALKPAPPPKKKPSMPDRVEVLAICHEAHSKTGGYRPIRNYIEATKAAGRETALIDLLRKDPSRKAALKFPKADITIINSIAPLEWKAVNDYLATNPENVFFYLHEMDWIMDRIQRDQPDLYARFTEALKRYPVLCVSELQKDFVDRTFNPPASRVVYNVTRDGNLDPRRVRSGPSDEGQEKTILMVGTIQKRKGPDLFGQVADLAKAKGLPLGFAWAGHQTEPVGELSQNVDWMGFKKPDELREVMRKSDCFLLTSWDDPFPLSCLEALSWGVPVVSYHYSGVCEIIEGMPGCGVFRSRDPQDVLDELMRALEDGADPMRLFFHARPYIDCNHFIKVLDETTEALSRVKVTA